MRAVGAVEAETMLGHLLDQVEHGEQIAITRHGKVVARLVPPDPGFDRERARLAVAGILETSRGVRLDGLTVKELVAEGRP